MRLPPATRSATRLVLVRHGEPDESARGRVYGHLDMPLSAAGREQAARTAEWLAPLPIAAIYSSTLQRAIETARPLAAALGLAVEERESLRELCFGALEGMPYEEVLARHPKLYEDFLQRPGSVRFPDGEGYAELRARVLEAEREIRARHAGSTVAVVAHGGVHRVLIAEALGLGADALFRLDLGYGAVSILDHYPTSSVLRLHNGSP